MSCPRTVSSLTLLMALGLMATTAQAASPWRGLFTNGSVDSDPEKSYTISETSGPWMIMACSFSGEGAEGQARDLVLELRKRYKVEAFVHKVRFDLGKAEAIGFNRFGERRRGRYRPGSKIEEYAVLVGNYQTVDDPDAQKTLEKLKYAHPKCLEVGEGKSTNQSLAGWRLLQKQVQIAMNAENKEHGPMSHAMVTTNPLLPDEFFASPGIDEAVLKLNSDVRYCLLSCPGRYSVQVAQFTGKSTIDQKKIKEQGEEAISEKDSKLIAAGEKAERLTELLRLKGYEAYCLHDRYASIVCVGSYDSVGTPRADGKIEINPEVHRIIETFRGEQLNVPGANGAVKPKKVADIMLDIQPLPVEVPKRSIGASYSRSMLSSQ